MLHAASDTIPCSPPDPPGVSRVLTSLPARNVEGADRKWLALLLCGHEAEIWGRLGRRPRRGDAAACAACRRAEALHACSILPRAASEHYIGQQHVDGMALALYNDAAGSTRSITLGPVPAWAAEES